MWGEMGISSPECPKLGAFMALRLGLGSATALLWISTPCPIPQLFPAVISSCPTGEDFRGEFISWKTPGALGMGEKGAFMEWDARLNLLGNELRK